MEAIKIIQKEIKTGNEPWEKEIRYFSETNDGFDGTAQGYGYKSVQAINKAYWFFKNKNKLTKQQNDAKQFLSDNLNVKSALKSYFNCENNFWMVKEGINISIKHFCDYYKSEIEIIEKLSTVKELWKSIEYVLNTPKKKGGLL